MRISCLLAIAWVTGCGSLVAQTIDADEGIVRRTPSCQLPRVVRAAIRSETQAAGTAHDAAVLRLVELARELDADVALPAGERRRLAAAVRRSLVRAEHRIKGESKSQATEEVFAQLRDMRAPRAGVARNKARPGARGNLPGAGAVPAGESNFNRRTRERGQKLVELIQATVAPNSWDVRGGPGTIVYFDPTRSLVARQTLEVHEELAPVLGNLRK